MTTLPPHLARIVASEYPRFSAAEMARRRAAVEALLARAACDHLVFCGANRFGSAVQWLTQWPVTAEAVGAFTPGKPDALFVQYVNHVPQARLIAAEAEVAWGGESSIAAVIAMLEKRGYSDATMRARCGGRVVIAILILSWPAHLSASC